jgi:hypothetical protein
MTIWNLMPLQRSSNCCNFRSDLGASSTQLSVFFGLLSHGDMILVESTQEQTNVCRPD